MFILGVDPGYDLTGFAIIEVKGNNLNLVHGGVIKTVSGLDYWLRLSELQSDFAQILNLKKLDFVGFEQVFFSKNVKTAIKVAQARGVMGTEVAKKGIKLLEFTPPQIKSAVTGNGKADKLAVQEMVMRTLGLNKIPTPDDFADAIAVALCTYQTVTNALGVKLHLDEM